MGFAAPSSSTQPVGYQDAQENASHPRYTVQVMGSHEEENYQDCAGSQGL